MSEILTFKVVGANKMNCGGCERAVRASLQELPGVSAVQADHTTQRIDVTSSGGVDGDLITRELAEIGYQVESA